MESHGSTVPEVRVIIPPKAGSGRKTRGKSSGKQYSKKKMSFKKQRTLIIIGAVAAAIILVLSFVYLFPNWSIIPEDEDHNVAPIPSIDVDSSLKKSTDFVTVDINKPVTFSAINSTDKDGNIEEYLWDFGDGTKAEGIKVQHTYTKSDTYTVTLMIVDNGGVSATTKMLVKVNAPPIAAFNLPFNSI